MEEFKKQIEAYSFPDSIEETKLYLEKYWLYEHEYLTKWKNIQSTMFSLNLEFPKMIVNSGYEFLVRKGGVLFEEQEFKEIQECSNLLCDNHILIVEDYNDLNPPHESGPILRLKYPSKITWDEINIYDGISYELFQRPVRNYFVFGDSGKWGKYAANDYELPVDIFLFKKEYENLFKKRFKASGEELFELKEFLPKEYFE